MTGTPGPDAPPTGAQARRPPLRRSRTDYVIGGVCGGLAEWTGVESFLWRIGFIVLGLLGGESILVYLVLWLVIPDADTAPPRGSDAGRPGFVERLRAGLTRSG